MKLTGTLCPQAIHQLQCWFTKVLVMPLFSRSSFRTPKKPPRRKADSVPNISTLGLEDTLNFTADSARVEGGGAPAVAMKLGGYDVSFEDGQWLVSKYPSSKIKINDKCICSN